MPINNASSVLIVDDSALNRKHEEMLCRQLGIEAILFATDGANALHVLETVNVLPNVIIVDLEMPQMDGVELIQEITRRNMKMDVIIASSRGRALLSTVETMAESMGASVLGALQKPLTAEVLDVLLRKHKPCTNPQIFHNRSPQTLDAIINGIRQQEFVCYFQPKISVANGTIQGVEALARWQHPQHGLLFPDCFIETIEAHEEVMKQFTLNILDNMLLHQQQWQASGLHFSSSLNVSAASFSDKQFIDEITLKVAASNIQPEHIIFEVTETALMTDIGASLGALARLRLKGFGLAIDDYGTGFSSLQQLNNIPATELKIDRAFVHEAHQRQNLRIMLEGAIDLGRKMNIAVVAEGVENIEDWQLLQQLDCQFAQGYLVARPMPGSKIANWVRDELPKACKILVNTSLTSSKLTH